MLAGALRGTRALARAGAARRGAGGHRARRGVAAQAAAAALVIGDEILRGAIQDTNTAWLAAQLHARGVDLVRAEVVPDEAEVIVESLHRLRRVVGPTGPVFTSGGIGPTHDDVTYDAVARASGVGLELHAPTVAKMREHYEAQGKELTDARLRMATLPQGCEVLETPGLWVPLVHLDAVYVLPGVPGLFKRMVEASLHRFRGPEAHSTELYTDEGEGDLGEALGAIAARHPAVQIGSYPETSRYEEGAAAAAGYTTKLSFVSRDPAALAAAVAEAEAAIPSRRP